MSATGSPVSMSLGQLGKKYSGPGTVTGDFGIVHALQATVATLTDSTSASSPDVDVPIPAGDSVFGRFSQVDITSGFVICYNAI